MWMLKNLNEVKLLLKQGNRNWEGKTKGNNLYKLHSCTSSAR